MSPAVHNPDERLDGPSDEHVADVMRVQAAAMAEARESAVELLALAGVAHPTTVIAIPAGSRFRCPGDRAVGYVSVGIAEVVGPRPSWWPAHVPTSTRPRPLL